MTDLLDETVRAIAMSGRTQSDVAFVEFDEEGPVATWEAFAKAARGLIYDSGYGSQEILPSLRIAFKDSTWLERMEYDGSEWWEHMVPPVGGRAFGGVPKLKADRYWEPFGSGWKDSTD
jgi:hypothetical protein